MESKRIWGFEKITSYASLVASILTIGFVCVAAYKSKWELNLTSVLISLSVVIVILAVVNMFLLRRYDTLDRESRKSYHTLERDISRSASTISHLEERVKDELKAKAKIVQIIHNYCHEYRNVINEIYSDLSSQDYSNFKSRENSFRMFIIYMLANIKEVFDILTCDEVSVCIKMLDVDEANGQFLVRTFMRDNISYRERSSAEKFLSEYPVHENTAFKVIMDPESSNSYYLCNNLREERGYRNANNDWEQSYNACLVVPIRIFLSEERCNVIGFICVDNLEGNFDDKIAVDILSSFGDNCFHIFNLFNDLSVLSAQVNTVKEGEK